VREISAYISWRYSIKAGERNIGVKRAFVFKESLLVAVCSRSSTEVVSLAAKLL